MATANGRKGAILAIQLKSGAGRASPGVDAVARPTDGPVEITRSKPIRDGDHPQETPSPGTFAAQVTLAPIRGVVLTVHRLAP